MISPDIQAQVVAAVLGGMSQAQAAREYRLSRNTVRSIVENLAGSKLNATPPVSEAMERQRESIDALLLDSLSKCLKMQTSVYEVCADAGYLRTQNARDVAALLEVCQAHSVRLLEAAGAIEGEEE